MSQYYVLVRINIVREPFIQHSDIIPRSYPPERSPLFDSNPRPRSPDSPISPPMSPPIFPRGPRFPRQPVLPINDLNFEVIGIFTSRVRAVDHFTRHDRLHLDRYHIFGPFRINHGSNNIINHSHNNRNEEDPNFYFN
jgi:hypothetical protein